MAGSLQRRRLPGNVERNGRMRQSRSRKTHRRIELQQQANRSAARELQNQARQQPNRSASVFEQQEANRVLHDEGHNGDGVLSARATARRS